MILASIGIMAVGLFLATSIRSETELPLLWIWMLITGVGIGPSFAIFTIVVQNAVPFEKLGVATSNLTFFRQIGGSVGLAIVGTIFGTTLQNEVPRQLVANGVPGAIVSQVAAGDASNLDQLVGVGQDLGAQILGQVPAQLRAVVEPLVPGIVNGIHEAFSLGIADTFRVGVVTTLVALLAAAFMGELPLRQTVVPRVVAAQVPTSGEVEELPAGREHGTRVSREAPAAD